MLNDQVGESFYIILVNQLDLNNLSTIQEILKFYNEEKLDYSNQNLIEIFSALIDKLPIRLENENAIFMKNTTA